MQKKATNLLMLSAAAVLLTACSAKLGALSADNFSVNPQPLETQSGTVPATISGLFPEKYMNKKAVVGVTPELHYASGKVTRGERAAFQGEKVMGNDQTISYRLGGRYTMKSVFPYEGENKADLYLTFDARIGDKAVSVPPVKVAEGIVATGELYRRTVADAQPCTSQDGFQRVTKQKLDANIRFLIQQAELRKSELRNNSVTEFVSLLQKINRDRDGLSLNSVEVSAYASPDGGTQLNEKLASKRQQNSEQYVQQQLRKQQLTAPVDAKYTAQDWEGFQQLVAASNIQDKQLILRVLSMYKDPEEREQQIKNMSAGFRELADGILPQLRRARLTINYETVGRSDAQIKEQLEQNASQLSLEEMLYAATLTSDTNEQRHIYEQTAKHYPNDGRAFNNMGALAFSAGDNTAARRYFSQALSTDPHNAEAQANMGLLALKDGDIKNAENWLAKAAGANGLDEALGNLHLAQGNYALAEDDFRDVFSNSAALSQLLNKSYATAEVTLKNVDRHNAMTDYLHAILCARQGERQKAADYLQSALAKDASLAAYAANDLELKDINK